MKDFYVLKVPPSETLAINALAQAKKKAGETVYNLSAGEPMIPAPREVLKAAEKALKENKTHYPPAAGIPELRAAASKWMNDRYGSTYATEETVVVNGGKLGLYLLFQALLKPGDELLVIAPYWVSYPNIATFFGGVSKFIKTDPKKNWKVIPQDIEKAAGPKTKLLILNNGGNPTGTLYSKKEIKAILEVAAKKNLLVISDEVYSTLVYDKGIFVSCAEFPEYKDMLIVVESCSKSLTVTGLRVGFVFAPKKIITSLSGLLSQSTSGVTTISQYAALGGLAKMKTIAPKITKIMQKRRDALVGEFNKVFKIKLLMPQSGLYAFVPLSALGWKGSSGEFCEQAIQEANVASVPGSAFGQESYVRFSFGEEEKMLKAGVRVLKKWLEKKP
jgi:aspartate/methionine/tyrosine aminotransferase